MDVRPRVRSCVPWEYVICADAGTVHTQRLHTQIITRDLTSIAQVKIRQYRTLWLPMTSGAAMRYVLLTLIVTTVPSR